MEYKTRTINNKFGSFSIWGPQADGDYTVVGNIAAAQYEFKQIHRRPPNEYGNFYGRKRAGNAACVELIKKYGLE